MIRFGLRWSWLLSVMGCSALVGTIPTFSIPSLWAAQAASTSSSAARGNSERPAAHRQWRHAAIATEHELATRAAMRAVERGGNAVDAAVTAALVSGVVAPASSGLGGGGFALLWLERAKRSVFLDFRETAPRALVEASLNARPLSAEERGRAIGVPGEPSGLYTLQRRYGRLAFRDVVDDATRLARQGFPTGAHLARVLKGLALGAPRRELLDALSSPASGIAQGRTIRFPALARTLEAYGRSGPVAFTHGAIAEDVVRAAKKYGSTLSLEDLRDYVPVEREPLRRAWGKYVVVTAPPPSAGGLLLLQTLGKFTLEEWSRISAKDERIHVLAESYRQSFADRAEHVGDPHFVDVPVGSMLSSESLTAQRRRIHLGETRHLRRSALEEHGTSHISIVDREGNAVALTTTVNDAFGSKVVAPESGVILNDELDDFSSGPNRPRALARPVSSMTPTLVFDGDQIRYVLGGSGGMTISTNVTSTLLGLLADGLSPSAAVEAPRFTVDLRKDALVLEPGFGSEVLDGLRRRGEPASEAPRWWSAVQVVGLDSLGARAASDPRKLGSAMVK
ncbi:MAG: gamma-glutamyltransferase [Polyangiaceae bacterium]